MVPLKNLNPNFCTHLIIRILYLWSDYYAKGNINIYLKKKKKRVPIKENKYPRGKYENLWDVITSNQLGIPKTTILERFLVM